MANDLLRSDSMNADAMYVRGLCLYYEDFVDKAFTHFQQVLRLAPDHQRAKATYKVRFLFKIEIYVTEKSKSMLFSKFLYSIQPVSAKFYRIYPDYFHQTGYFSHRPKSTKSARSLKV